MARKRMIDPEFWSDETIGKWKFETRLFYIALWNFADDEGRFKAHSKLLKAHIFPYDDKISIEELKKELGDKIIWYEADNSQYGFIRNFNKYQRIDKPTASKLPSPQVLSETSTNTPRKLPPNIREVNIKEDKKASYNYNIYTDKETSLKTPLKTPLKTSVSAFKKEWEAQPRFKGTQCPKEKKP